MNGFSDRSGSPLSIGRTWKGLLLALALLASAIVLVPGHDTAVATAPVTTTLSPGWNLVGYLGPSLAVGDALSQIDGEYKSVSYLDAESGTWRSFDPDAPPELSSLKVLDRFSAYLINMRLGGTLSWNLDSPLPLENPYIPASRLTVLPDTSRAGGTSPPGPIAPPPGSPLPYVRLVGEMTNLSTESQTAVTIVALSLGEDGNLQGILPYGRALRQVIPPGESSPFEFYAPQQGLRVDRVVIAAAGEPTDAAPPSASLLGVSVQRSQLVPEVVCTNGDVRNDGDTPISFARVVGSLYGGTGDIVATVEIEVADYYHGLAPGQTLSFEGCVNARPGAISGYSLWVDASPYDIKPEEPAASAPFSESESEKGVYRLSLLPGWNAFSYLGPTAPVAQALASLDGKYTTVTALDAASQSFPGYDGDAPSAVNDIATLERFKAYLIYMEQAGILDFEAPSPQPLVNEKLPVEHATVYADPSGYAGAFAGIVGEVHNLSGNNVDSMQVVAFLRDQRGAVTGIAPGYVLRSIVPDGELAPFQSTFGLKGEYAGFDVITAGRVTDRSPVAGLTLPNLTEPRRPYPGSTVCVGGELRNDTDRSFYYALIVGSLYGEDGDVIRVVQGAAVMPVPPPPKEPPHPVPVEGLGPGETAPFEACTYPDVSLSEVKGFHLWVEAEPSEAPPPLPGPLPPGTTTDSSPGD